MSNLSEDRPESIFLGIAPIERFVIISIFVLLIIIVGGINISQGESSLILVFVAFSTYVITLSFPIFYYHKKGGWLHPIIFTVLWFELIRGILPKLSIYSTGLQYHSVLTEKGFSELNNVVTEYLLLQVVALISMYVGFFLFTKLKAPKVTFKKPKNILSKVITIAFISLIAFWVLLGKAGSIGQLLLQRGLPPELRINAAGYWYVMIPLLKIACIVWLALRVDIWKRWYFLLLFTLSFFLGFAATGSRSGIVAYLILAFIIWCIQWQKVPYGKGLALGLIGIILIGILGNFRTASRGVSTVEEINIDTGIVKGIKDGISNIGRYTGRIDGGYAILGNVSNNQDLLYGQSYLSIPAAFIPRTIWQTKPEAGGRLVAMKLFNGRSGGVPPHSVGEAYWNFHIPGVIFIFIIWGVFLKWLYSFYKANQNKRGVLIFYVFTLFLLQPNSPAFYEWLHVMVPATTFLIFFCGLPRFENK